MSFLLTCPQLSNYSFHDIKATTSWSVKTPVWFWFHIKSMLLASALLCHRIYQPAVAFLFQAHSSSCARCHFSQVGLSDVCTLDLLENLWASGLCGWCMSSQELCNHVQSLRFLQSHAALFGGTGNFQDQSRNFSEASGSARVSHSSLCSLMTRKEL